MSNSSNTNRIPSATVIAFTLTFFLLATYLWTANRGTPLEAPPAAWNIDGVFYDNLGVNLKQGNGFVVDFGAADWRQRYQVANGRPPTVGEYEWVMQYVGSGATTMRSPGYPFALSAIYRVFGHDWKVARLFGCLFVSLGLALLVNWIFSQWGLLAAVVTTSTLLLDYSVMQSAGLLASEGLAILLLSVFFLLAIKALDAPSFPKWLACGVAFAALILTRGSWNLGLLILLLASISILIPAVRRKLHPTRPSHLATFFLTTIVICMPWWIRNCNTTGQFQPFGTAGSCGSVAAYCDDSYNNFGQWQPEVFAAHQREVQSQIDVRATPLAEREVLTSDASIQKAKAWAQENWQNIPLLMVYRSISHWGFFNPSVPAWLQAANGALIGVGLLGCFFATGQFRRGFIVILAVDTLIVMLTWEHLGRYAIPVRPLVHLGYGLIVASVIRKLAGGRWNSKPDLKR